MMARHAAVQVSRPFNHHSHATGYSKPPVVRASPSSVSLPIHKRSGSPFGALPRDLWEHILTYLTPPELVKVAQLNSTFFTTVTTSITWRFYSDLFPTSRKIWALSWNEAYDGYITRTAPPTGRELVSYNITNGLLSQDQTFSTLFLNTNRRVIEFFGPSVRHRHDTFLTQADNETHSCRSWRITSTPQYSMGHIMSVQKRIVSLPPRSHHLRPAGLDVVGTYLFWVDYFDQPVGLTLNENGIHFEDDVGENVLWPDGIFDDTGEEVCLLHKLFLSWGESQFEFSGQMVCAADSVEGHKQVLRLYDYQTNRTYGVPFDEILGSQGPWLGPWRAPWILPWGFDDDGNLLFKILDTRIENGVERIRCVQTSFNLERMRTTFSVEILEDIQLLNPWNFQMFSDQCWGYPAKDANGDIWCILRDLRDGNMVRRVGPLNRPGTQPTDYSCHISMFHIIFQDKSSRFASRTVPANAPLRIFSIKPVPPAIRRQYDIPRSTQHRDESQMLYELSAPPHPDPPGLWMFGGEDAAERYLFFQGSTIQFDDAALSNDWKKWVVWDSFRREWSVLHCHREWGSDGYYCLFSESDGVTERVGLDWVRMELAQ